MSVTSAARWRSTGSPYVRMVNVGTHTGYRRPTPSMPAPHYFDPAPAGRSDPRVVPLALPDLTLELTTDRGVFSADRVDPGTKLLLLEAPAPPPAGELLDLGCGYG